MTEGSPRTHGAASELVRSSDVSAALEAILFSSNRALKVRELQQATDADRNTIEGALEKLREAYHTHSATVSVPVLLIGWLLASAPGARALLNPPLLHAFRSRMASALDLK